MPRLALRRPRIVLAAWLAVIGALAIAGLGVEQRLHRTDIKVQGTPGARADAQAARYFGDSQTLVVLLEGPRAAIDAQGPRLAARLDARPGLAVLGPWTPEASSRLRPARDRALLLVRANRDFETVSRHIVPAVRAEVTRTIALPLSAHVSGYPDIANGMNEAAIAALRRAELLAAPLLLLVLLAVFRSPLAAAIPLFLGMTTIGAAAGVLDLVNRLTPVDAVGLNMASMFGLALGVDYSLVIVSRFREEIARGADPTAAARTTAQTAIRTVIFAGAALAAAMLAATFIAPSGVLASSGAGTLAAAGVSVLGAATALPALLVLVGRHLDRWQFGRLRPGDSRLGGLAASAVARPVLAGGAVLILILGLAAPALALNMTAPDPRDLPTSRPERRDFDAIFNHLPGGWTAPYDIIVANPHGPVTDARHLALLDRWQQRLAGLPRVRAVLGPAPLHRRSREAARAGRAMAQLGRQLGSSRGGLARLSTGLGRLDRGMADVRGGLADAADAATRLAAGGDAAGVGADQLQRGLARARTGSVALQTGVGQTRAGAAHLGSGIARARRGARRLARALGAVSRETAAGLPQVQRLAAGLRTGSHRLSRLQEPVHTTEQQLAAALDALERMQPTSKADPSYAAAYEAVLRAQGAVSGRDPTGAPVAQGYDGLSNELAKAGAGARSAADGVDRIGTQLGRLHTALERMRAGAGELAGGLDRLAAGNRRLRRALARLGHGGRRLTAGLADLQRGNAELAAGLHRVHSGADRLAGGLRSGSTRSAALTRGVSRMRTGVNRVRVRAARARAGGGAGLSTRVFDSGYLTLAGLDTAAPATRSASTFAVNLDRGGSATRLVVIEGGDPTKAGDPLRKRLQQEAHALSAQTGLTVAVGGPAATLQDFASAASGRLDVLIAALVLITYLVLVPILRSVVLPLLAIALNVLTVAAAFGVLTLGFQGDAPLGGPGEVDAIMVLAIFAIVFGLSIDYEVFLLARIREGYSLTGTTRGAIDYGLRHTGGVITGAALIMSGVFVAFALSDVTNMRQLGVGLTVAVLLDATLVRLLLLPAAIRLAGAANWWLPRWLDRLLPAVRLEAKHVTGDPLDALARDIERRLGPEPATANGRAGASVERSRPRQRV